MTISRIVFLLSLIINTTYTTTHAQPLPQTLPAPYTINDLQVLEAEKNYAEFFLHARDVRPESRDGEWKNLVSIMAESYIYDQKKKKIVDSKTISFLNSLLEWPILRGSIFFLDGRGKIGLKFFKDKLSESSRESSKESSRDKKIFKEILAFWELNKDNPKLGLELLRLVIEYEGEKEIDPFVFIEKGVGSELGAEICKDAEAKKYLVRHLFEILLKEEEDSKINSYLVKKISSSCWSQIVLNLKEMLTQPVYNNQNQLNAYRILKLKNAISLEEDELFLITYILQAPINGAVFNNAWNEIKKLGKNYELRSKIFEKIKKIDPLPGKSFSIITQDRKRILLDHIHQNFPEYMDFYAKTCLEYLVGKRTFINGNPTMYCRDLFSSAEKFEKNNWVDLQLRRQYKELPKL
ncbi:MAG: hypothetical protein HQK51_04045 [Oligoflexia bacterium]|nr:hypothetical protein [Oligoflexia bacterium]